MQPSSSTPRSSRLIYKSHAGLSCNAEFCSGLQWKGKTHLSRRRTSLIAAHAGETNSNSGRNSSPEDLARLKRELDEQQARIQAQIKALTPEELQQFSELISKQDSANQVSETRTGQEANNETSSEKISDPILPARDAEEPEFMDIPEDIRRMLEEAGVEGAMEWKGIPAKPPKHLQPDTGLPISLLGSKARASQGEELNGSATPNSSGPDWLADLGLSEAEDDEYMEGDEDEEEWEPGQGVKEIVAKLERGEPLGPDPMYEGLEVESFEDFQTRMLKYRQAYEAQFLPRKDWKISPEDYKEIMNQKIDADFEPWETPDITDVQPAPDWPDPQHQVYYDRAQWILFLLRKCYMLPQPDCASKALFNKDLVASDVIFEDPFVESIGSQAWIDYTERVCDAGGIVEIGHIWSEMGTEKPYPIWIVWVDLWLSIPYPDWYYEYMFMHLQFDDPPNLKAKKLDQPAPPDPFAPEPNTWNPTPLRYPKGKIKLEDVIKEPEEAPEPLMGSQGPWSSDASSKAQQKSLRDFSLARQEAHAYERGYESPLPSASQKSPDEISAEQEQAEKDRLLNSQKALDNFVSDKAQKPNAGKASGKGEGSDEVILLQTMRECIRQSDIQTEGAQASMPVRAAAEFDANSDPPPFMVCQDGSCKQSGPFQRLMKHELYYDDGTETQPLWRPSLQGLPPTVQEELVSGPYKQRLRSCTKVSIQDSDAREGGQFEVLRYQDTQARNALKVPEPRDPDDWPDCPDPGQAWRSSEYFCIPMTIAHVIDNSLGQVKTIHAEWGAIIGDCIGTQQDLLDVYARELRLWEDFDPASQRIKVARRE